MEGDVGVLEEVFVGGGGDGCGRVGFGVGGGGVGCDVCGGEVGAKKWWGMVVAYAVPR